VNDHPTEISVLKDVKPVEEAVRTLWDKIRTATELISRLKQERSTLQHRVSALEQELSSLRSALSSKEQELKKVRSDYSQSLQGANVLGASEEEREILKNRIHDLIAKINSHL
jgi:chromosome segregation ATPase